MKMAGRCLCSVFLSHFGSLGGSFSKIVRKIVPKSCAKSLELEIMGLNRDRRSVGLEYGGRSTILCCLGLCSTELVGGRNVAVAVGVLPK